MAKSYRELRVWNQAMDLAVLTYSVTRQFPKDELFGLTSQMRRAAVSIASNIAEGSARSTRKDFRQFIVIAKGSTCELQTQLTLAKRLGLGNAERVGEAEQAAQEVAQMLSGLSQYLSNSSHNAEKRSKRAT